MAALERLFDGTKGRGLMKQWRCRGGGRRFSGPLTDRWSYRVCQALQGAGEHALSVQGPGVGHRVLPYQDPAAPQPYVAFRKQSGTETVAAQHRCQGHLQVYMR